MMGGLDEIELYKNGWEILLWVDVIGLDENTLWMYSTEWLFVSLPNINQKMPHGRQHNSIENQFFVKSL